MSRTGAWYLEQQEEAARDLARAMVAEYVGEHVLDMFSEVPEMVSSAVGLELDQRGASIEGRTDSPGETFLSALAEMYSWMPHVTENQAYYASGIARDWFRRGGVTQRQIETFVDIAAWGMKRRGEP